MKRPEPPFWSPPGRTAPGVAVPADVYDSIRASGRRAMAVAALVCSGLFYGVIAIAFLFTGNLLAIIVPLGIVLGPVIAGPRIWSLLAAVNRDFHPALGTLSGVLTALVGHLSMAVVAAVFAGARHHASSGTSLFGYADRVTDLFDMSLRHAGWLTLMMGAIGGSIVTLWCRDQLRRGEVD